MSMNDGYAGLLGPWPPSGLAPLLDPAQGRMQGLLPSPSAPQPTMGLLDVPGDPSSLFGQPFDPMQGGQGAASPSSTLDPGGWLQALQALHASLRGASQLATVGGDPGSEASTGLSGAAQPPPTSPASIPASAAPAAHGGDLLSFDPNRLVTSFKPSGLVQIQAPSPHAGDYATGDEAAKAGQADIPKDSADEYGTWITKHEVPITFPDIGKGPVPFLLDRFSYPGLFTSNDPDKVFFGAAPPDAAYWLHNHPNDSTGLGNDYENNDDPSPADNDGSHGDWYWAHQIQKTNPNFGTYIVGPDGVLRRFQHNNGDMVVVK